MRTMTGLTTLAVALILFCFQADMQTWAQTAPTPPPRVNSVTTSKAQPRPKLAEPSVGKQPAAQPAPSGKSVCVASVIGREFEVRKIGFTVFGNELNKVAVDSWGVDDLVVRKIQEVAGRGHAVRRLAVSAADLTLLEAKPFSGWTSSPMQDFLAVVAGSGPRCAMYIVVTPGGSPVSGNQNVFGLGIVTRDSLITIVDQTRVYAAFFVQAFDGKTFKLLRTEKPTTLLVNAFTGGLSAMDRAVDKTWVPKPPEGAVQNTQLRAAIRALVEEGTARAARAIFEGP